MKTKYPFLISFVFFLVATVPALGQSTDLNGEQIVAKMAKEYASAKSYQDNGIVQASSGVSNGPLEKIVAFKTYFVRPKRIRFEWIYTDKYSDSNFQIVWSDGKDTFTYWVTDPVEKNPDLSSGIAGATGVSRGSGHTIPALLLEEISGFRMTEMTRLSLLREERFEDENCYVVEGFHPFGFPYHLWISKRDFLIRKLSRRNEKNEILQEEIRRNVKLNVPIAADMFNYKPPKTPQKPESKNDLRPVASHVEQSGT